MRMTVEEQVRRRRVTRIEKLKKQYYASRFHIDSKRALLVTEAYKETEGEPLVVRRAKALKKICEGIDVYILPGELIVGHAAYKPRSAQVFPEFSVHWIEEELDEFESRPQDPFIVSESVKSELRSVIPYWKGRTLYDHCINRLPHGTRRLLLEERHFALAGWSGFIAGMGHYLPNYEIPLKKGFRGIRKEAESHLERLVTPEDILEKGPFLQAVMTAADAYAVLAQRYAREAKKLALDTTDMERARELDRIAEVCSWVSENPARTFHEAIQMLWFIQLIVQHLETNGASIGIGNFDQFMYPYYRQDIETGRACREEILELIECFYIKLAEEVILRDKASASNIANFSMGQHIALGGQSPEGKDLTNDLSWLCLEARRDVPLIQPDMSVKWHENMSREFFLEACRLIRDKNAEPQIVNDDSFRRSLISRGFSEEDAWNYSMYGCNELAVPGKTAPYCNTGSTAVKCLELALNDGKCLLCGNQIGPKTGDPSHFQSFEDVMRALKTQIDDFARHITLVNGVQAICQSELIPMAFCSALMDTCIQRGKEVNRGGVDYYYSKSNLRGLGTLADSVAAIKKIVFDEKRISMSELVDALRRDFKGREPLRQMLMNCAPKYGNDDEYVDSLAIEAVKMWREAQEKYRDPRGGKLAISYWPGYISNTANVSLGRQVGATPDGRRAGQPLSDGISPSQGRCAKGASAAMKSVAKLKLDTHNSVAFNMKFTPSSLAGERNLERFKDLIEAYLELGGAQVQFNVISAETLMAAQQNPEQYRDLLVRVVGYSALFVELSKEVQDDIISRTQFEAVS